MTTDHILKNVAFNTSTIHVSQEIAVLLSHPWTKMVLLAHPLPIHLVEDNVTFSASTTNLCGGGKW